MKRILLLPIIAALVIPFGCTKDFQRINTSPTAASPASFDANYFLSNAQNTYKEGIAGYQGPILFQAGWSQIIASTSSGSANYYSNADKYVPSSNTNSYLASSWTNCFRSASLATQIIKDYGTNATQVNAVSAAYVMRALAISYAADVYGDLPYSEAFQAELGITQPKYDKQQAVLVKLLQELETNIPKFDATKPKPTADLFYAGDVAKWKKLGYSVMLRIAMRMTKADVATAKTYAEKAYAGGTMAATTDDCILVGNNANGYSSPNGRALLVTDDLYQVRWSKKLMDYLQSTADPRIAAVAEVPVPGIAGNTATTAGDNTAANQLGMPNGYDLNGGATDISLAPGYPGSNGAGADACKIGKYSRPRASVYDNRDAPVFIMSYAESELLLAEASSRGWSTGSAATHYANGVTAGIVSVGTFGAAASAIATPAAAAAYATANPLTAVAANQLQQINEQYWATTGLLMNFAESWSNWRRSGFPVLTAVNYTGNFSGGTIPRRQLYPTGEVAVNPTNYAAGVASLGGTDSWTARVWWDK